MGNVQLDADFLLEGLASQAVVDERLQHVVLGTDVGPQAVLNDIADMAGMDNNGQFLSQTLPSAFVTYPIMAPKPLSSPSLGKR